MHRWVLICIAMLFFIGCGGAKTPGSKRRSGAKSGGELGQIDTSSRCEVGKDMRESLVDLNQDKVPDVRKVYRRKGDTEVLVCREADLNFDGSKDMFVFFDENGELKRDEVDLDYDGVVDIVSAYAGGKAVKQELDTNSDTQIDRVRFLEDGLPSRLEADTDGDGKVDYWEYYDAGRLIRVGMDTDGDGRADSWSRDEPEMVDEQERDTTEKETAEEEGEEEGDSEE